MKVILLEDVKGKGYKDSVIEVPGGYGSHLIRNNQAIEASKTGLKILAQQHEKVAQEQARAKKTAEANKKILESRPLEFKLNTGQNGRVFKSVSSKHITEQVYQQFNIKLDKRKFLDKAAINTLGTTKVRVELFKGVIATLNVVIKSNQ
jgi:large subunit ribosomal protein L9